MKPEFEEIKIRAEYVREIERIIKHSGGFENVSDYVNFVLRELLSSEDASGSDSSGKIRDRLKGLGYLS